MVQPGRDKYIIRVKYVDIACLIEITKRARILPTKRPLTRLRLRLQAKQERSLKEPGSVFTSWNDIGQYRVVIQRIPAFLRVICGFEFPSVPRLTRRL